MTRRAAVDPSDPALTLASAVYGHAGAPPDDPAELYHEASKLVPELLDRQSGGIARLTASEALQAATARGFRRNRQLPPVPLPPNELPLMPLAAALRARRSAAPSPGGSCPFEALATILAAGYGVRSPAPGTIRRSAPSGGALYPLELYVAARSVDGLEPGIYHLDAHRSALERLPADDGDARLRAASAYPGLLDDATAVVFTTAVFWRTRFKYGLRGYRFALLEAGHAAQNMLLAAAALELEALPLGGFYDDRVEQLLGVDGVDESVVHAVVLGGRTP